MRAPSGPPSAAIVSAHRARQQNFHRDVHADERDRRARAQDDLRRLGIVPEIGVGHGRRNALNAGMKDRAAHNDDPLDKSRELRASWRAPARHWSQADRRNRHLAGIFARQTRHEVGRGFGDRACASRFGQRDFAETADAVNVIGALPRKASAATGPARAPPECRRGRQVRGCAVYCASPCRCRCCRTSSSAPRDECRDA